MQTLDISFLLLNELLCVLFYSVVLAITGRTVLTFFICSCITFAINYADICVFTARLTHIRLTDFTAITQAARVASHYELIWGKTQWVSLVILVLMTMWLLFIQHFTPSRPNVFQNRVIACSTLLILIIVLVEGTIVHFLPTPQKFSGFNANQNVGEAGLIGTWYSQVIHRKTEKPEGYDKRIAKGILDRYEEATVWEMSEKVNIIVIMNESLTDYSLLGKTKFDDPLPYIHSMVKSGQLFEGKLAASVLGGGTCNTEWEFVTGNSLLYLPDGVYAYMTYVNRPSPSIARELSSVGYATHFFHPYYSQEWNRENVYSFFGFDEFTAGDSLEGGLKNKESLGNITQSLFQKGKEDALVFGEGLEYKRGLISDSQTYKLLLDMLSLEDSLPNDFMFCVTIQNHGGYNYEGDDFESAEYVTGNDTYKYALETYNGEYTSRPSEVNQYLTLSNLSDSAFRELIEALSQVDEKTVVVMFGDHQPGIKVSDYMDYDDSVHFSAEEETHVVPYIIWANYDLDYDFPEYISANYLSSVIKDSVGLPLNAWDKFRLDAMKVYPVMTTGFVMDSEYNVVSDTETDLLRDYSYVQYWRMFEK